VSRRARIAVFAPALAGFASLLGWGVAGIPAFGHYRGPYGFILERIVTPERHVTNVVTGTVFDVRGFDTLGEEFILFAAVVGVVLLLRGHEREHPADVGDTVASDAVRVLGTLMVGAGVLIGLWLVAFGFVTPGGGFQGGVAIAAGALLLYIAAGVRAWKGLGDERILDPLEGLGAGGYAIVGLAALVSGMPFLANLFGSGTTGTLVSGGSAVLVNWAAALEIAAANLVLYTEFLHEYIAPLGGGRVQP
jgi:multicomponent Na+:H+ antiporter subunit B